MALCYDTLKQVFPKVEPCGAFDYRAHEDFEIVGDLLTNLSQTQLEQS